MRVLLIVYDNESYIHWFPQGIAYIAAVLRKAGHDVVIFQQDIHHWTEEHLTQYLEQEYFDVVGLGFIGGYYQYRKAIKISEAINSSKGRPPIYILGGHGPSPEPEYFLKKLQADIVIIGEGEITFVELLKAIEKKMPLNNVNGIAYFDHTIDEIIKTPRRELIKDIDSIPWPAYDMFLMEYYRLLRMPNCTPTDFVMPILSGRGCTFTCNFCYRMDEGFRARGNEPLIEEIRYLKQRFGINYITFGDELLMSSKDRTISLCEDLIEANLGIKWDCNGRLNYAVPEVLKIMKRAGCVFINYGIEAFDDAALKAMHKALNTKQIIRGIETTLEVGISPGYNIIFGNIGENSETLRKGVEFLLKYDDGAQMRTIRPVTPYPGSPLYYEAIKNGLLKDVEDFYEKKHLNSDLLSINFTTLADDEYYIALKEANLILLENYNAKKIIKIRQQVEDLYGNKNVSFRGFRQS